MTGQLGSDGAEIGQLYVCMRPYVINHSALQMVKDIPRHR